MTEPRIVECVTGHWCGERAALTISGACPICGMCVTCETDAIKDMTKYAWSIAHERLIDDLVDEPVIVRSDRGDYDPLADTK